MRKIFSEKEASSFVEGFILGLKEGFRALLVLLVCFGFMGLFYLLFK